MFVSLDFLYVPAKEIDAAIHYYTEQLGGEFVSCALVFIAQEHRREGRTNTGEP